jgi:hypothetical protein
MHRCQRSNVNNSDEEGQISTRAESYLWSITDDHASGNTNAKSDIPLSDPLVMLIRAEGCVPSGGSDKSQIDEVSNDVTSTLKVDSGLPDLLACNSSSHWSG